jgi:hypothetical protein
LADRQPGRRVPRKAKAVSAKCELPPQFLKSAGGGAHPWRPKLAALRDKTASPGCLHGSTDRVRQWGLRQVMRKAPAPARRWRASSQDCVFSHCTGPTRGSRRRCRPLATTACAARIAFSYVMCTSSGGGFRSKCDLPHALHREFLPKFLPGMTDRFYRDRARWFLPLHRWRDAMQRTLCVEADGSVRSPVWRDSVDGLASRGAQGHMTVETH